MDILVAFDDGCRVGDKSPVDEAAFDSLNKGVSAEIDGKYPQGEWDDTVGSGVVQQR